MVTNAKQEPCPQVSEGQILANETNGSGYADRAVEGFTSTPAEPRRLVIGDGAPRRAFEVVILPVLQRPEKSEQADQPEPQRQRHQKDQHFHQDLLSATLRARSALSMTRIEEPDIAAAAISGVTTPLIAIGTARKL